MAATADEAGWAARCRLSAGRGRGARGGRILRRRRRIRRVAARDLIPLAPPVAAGPALPHSDPAALAKTRKISFCLTPKPSAGKES